MGPKKEVQAVEEMSAASAPASASDVQATGPPRSILPPEHLLQVSLVMLPCVVGAKRPLTGTLAVVRPWPLTLGSAAL